MLFISPEFSFFLFRSWTIDGNLKNLQRLKVCMSDASWVSSVVVNDYGTKINYFNISLSLSPSLSLPLSVPPAFSFFFLYYFQALLGVIIKKYWRTRTEFMIMFWHKKKKDFFFEGLWWIERRKRVTEMERNEKEKKAKRDISKTIDIVFW